MVHQHFMLARPLSVVENIMAGKKSRRGFLLDTRETADEIAALAERYKMKLDPLRKIWQLSVGEQQRVEILSAIYCGADILILDEPTAVLSPQEIDSLFETLSHMRADGKSIVLITHKLEEIVSIADEVTVLRDGKLVGGGKVEKETKKQDLSRMMVGRDVLFDFRGGTAEPGEKRLRLDNVSADNDQGLRVLDNISLDIRAGEILGLAGVDGNGQRELCEIMTGLRRAEGGSYSLDGQEMLNRPPRYYIEKGISCIPEDRHTTGLALDWSVKKNMILRNFRKPPFLQHGLLNGDAIDKNWIAARDNFQIKAENGDMPARSLSGGNQQKVILARELSRSPALVIASQPTRGLDISASEYVRQQLLDARSRGAAVLLISADLEEIIQLSDRIAVIYGGRIRGTLDRGAVDHEIGRLMTGSSEELAEAANG
jgi:simple sugar transport system ATP-binding protein